MHELVRGRGARGGSGAAGRDAGCYFLTASFTLAPACLRFPLAWSLRPSARRRRLPVTRPARFLTPPFMASALWASLWKMLIVLPFEGLSWGYSAGADALTGSSAGRTSAGSPAGAVPAGGAGGAGGGGGGRG